MASILKLPGWHDVKEVLLHHLNTEERKEAVLICKDFHNTICYLERHKRLNIDDELLDSMKDRKVFGSVMNSSRRFSDIEVNVRQDTSPAQLIFYVVRKFNRQMKKLTVNAMPQTCSAGDLTSVLDVATDVGELSLSIWEHAKLQHHNFGPKKAFSKLKHLSISGLYKITGILSKIPDHSLEGLSVEGDKLSEGAFQAFVDRQTKLKKLSLHDVRELNVDNLSLEELILNVDKDDKKLAALLKQQPALRRLECGTIGSAAFNELRKMPHLEVLATRISMECAGELENLKHLKLYGSYWPNGIFRRVVLPKLEKLENPFGLNATTTEDIIALSRSSHNLQRIEIQNRDINFLPTIIDHFPVLKTLIVNNSTGDGPYEGGNIDQALSHQNLILEEMVVHRFGASIPIGSLYDVINACPNLKRISLRGMLCNEQQVLGLIRNHPQLTHFVFNDSSEQLFVKDIDDGDDEDSLHPLLMEIVNIFRASEDFKLLSFENMTDWGVCGLDDFLTADADRIIVQTYLHGTEEITFDLKLVKKSKGRDLSEYF